jgi:hypothetical protein
LVFTKRGKKKPDFQKLVGMTETEQEIFGCRNQDRIKFSTFVIYSQKASSKNITKAATLSSILTCCYDARGFVLYPTPVLKVEGYWEVFYFEV